MQSLQTFGRIMVGSVFFRDILTFGDVSQSLCTEELMALRILKDGFGQMLLLLKVV